MTENFQSRKGCFLSRKSHFLHIKNQVFLVDVSSTSALLKNQVGDVPSLLSLTLKERISPKSLLVVIRKQSMLPRWKAGEGWCHKQRNLLLPCWPMSCRKTSTLVPAFQRLPVYKVTKKLPASEASLSGRTIMYLISFSTVSSYGPAAQK